MLICLQPCDRAKRPLGCRLFPLTPCPGRKGWTVRMDARARAMCPLSRGAGLRGLSPEFLKAARRAVLCIAQTPEGGRFCANGTRWRKNFAGRCGKPPPYSITCRKTHLRYFVSGAWGKIGWSSACVRNSTNRTRFFASRAA